MLQPVENTVILELEIPRENFLVCSMDCWGYRVNYWYIPLDQEDEENHKKELKRLCIPSEDALVLTDKGNFYPLLRRKIIQSWQRVFTLPPKNKQDEVATTLEMLEGIWDEYQVYENDEINYIDDSLKMRYARLGNRDE